ncbi:DUF5682 family protein [Mycobacteroides salmoniphilum]|uniref:DUF5682 family protein n=1 Tax=Mycobacteroides salmoniphilum TaxID=404941 RepID=UPI0010EC9ED5|nr:DUF5682 family protein [Mycobacteroides salmoniphilum]TDZ93977.1 hypothetical protein CCUG62472_02161 [Mycobacteroides salmoniphilum]
MTATVHVLGVRHHGPGSARAVLAALDRINPDRILIEGPSDADHLIPLVTAEGMIPPVAILGYAPDNPRLSAFWPLGVFSPEWQAMVWASSRGVPVGFCDQPTGTVLAESERESRSDNSNADSPGTDPIAALANAAGYDDPERWWDDVIESRSGDQGFDAITEAMGELRQDGVDDRDLRREAHMRQVLRKNMKASDVGHVAVVCGAWHAPALTGKLTTATADTALLRDTPKRKTQLTWVPWTHSRLAYASGYGAGVLSPGWYHHLFTAPDRPVERWLTSVAYRLREKDVPVSSAHIIESARLADALATMRRRPLAGLAEVTEATEAVMCEGEPMLVDLIWRDLVVGEALGTIPDDTPMVPLEADLRATAKSLRLKIDPLTIEVVLDLRKPNDLGKSHLLHRLNALDIGWGTPAATRGTGTFKEGWSLTWRPELAVDIVVAAVWGSTVATAASARLIDRADSAETLAHISDALEAALLAELPQAISPILAALDARAAVDSDIEHLMAALPALARAQRYGDVRGTSIQIVADVAASLLVRICAGLPAAVTGLGEDAAQQLRPLIDGVNDATALMSEERRADWLSTLIALANRGDVNGILVGRLVRILFDARRIDANETAVRLQRALSTSATPVDKAQWLAGFLAGGGVLLVHDRMLLNVIDEWLTKLRDDTFTDLLPLLRRTFSEFETPVRRNIAENLRAGTGVVTCLESTDLDTERAAPAVATVARILGLDHE